MTRYHYAVPVALGPHLLRLAPRGAGRFAQDLRISPEPVFRRDETDAWGNRVTRLAFAGTTRTLTVDSLVSLDTDGAAAPVAGAGPAAYLAAAAADPALDATAARLRALAGPDPDAFALSLAQTLAATVAPDTGAPGRSRTPDQVLAARTGTSGDVAGLFVALCRRAGLPARFVSGYRVGPGDGPARQGLHLWPEVDLPGLGWRGFDPVRGIRLAGAAETHVALAVAPDRAGTLPVVGSQYGAGTDTRLDVSLAIERAG